jgi:hypothetical protein
MPLSIRYLRRGVVIAAMTVIAYDGATHPGRLYISLVLVLIGLWAVTTKRFVRGAAR